MFYIGIKSGLGNQMFQYAHGLAASKKSGLPVSLDISAYDRQFAKDTPRSFTLQKYNIAAPIASASETARFHTPIRIFLRRLRNKIRPFANLVFDPREFEIRDGQYKEGYWQSERYFEEAAEEVRAQFTLKGSFGKEAEEAIAEIESKRSAGISTILVHVRRGDFVTNPHSIASIGVLPPEYFSSAIALIMERLSLRKPGQQAHVFFASEDPEWIRENIKIDCPSSVISRPGIQDYEELLIMSKCDHFAISNSSFSWWAAWLASGSGKIVVAPKRWRVDPNERTDDALPPNWIKI